MVNPSIKYVGDVRIRDLLAEYACPVPFHAVRTRFLGNIATLRLDDSPVQAVTGLWDGELPEVDDMDAVNALFQDLIGLWNDLTKHQSRNKPFRLVRGGAGATADDLTRLCRMRTEEIEGFVEGLFGDAEEMDLPERAHEGMERLGEIDAMLHGIVELLQREPEQASSESDLAVTFRNVRKLTRIAETELHAVVLSCKRARAQGISAARGRRPTTH